LFFFFALEEEDGALWGVECNMLEVIILRRDFIGVAFFFALLIILCVRWELALVMLRSSRVSLDSI